MAARRQNAASDDDRKSGSECNESVRFADNLAIQLKRVEGALRLLFEAVQFAQDVQRDVWDFAVEITWLQESGFTHSDFRWLVCKGFIKHARESRELNSAARRTAARQFHAEPDLSFCQETCFVLTREGIIYARDSFGNLPLTEIDGDQDAGNSPGDECEIAPLFRIDTRELIFRDQVVKRFKLPSPNQEAILIAFEEDGWPRRMDDPLPPHPDYCPKQRLLDTIKSLNRNQRTQLLRFSGDGTGEGICWDQIEKCSH